MSETDPTRVSMDQWEQVATAWEAHRERLFEDTRAVSEWLVDRVDPRPGETLLEVTAGPGETGFLAVERLGPDGRLISTDFVPAMVDAARRGAAARGIDRAEFRVMDVQQMDLPDGSVDAALSRFGIMLVPDPERALREIRRVVGPEGRFAYATWGPPDRNPWLFLLVAALLQHGVELPGDPFSAGGVFSLSTPERNQQLATAAGFSDVVVEEVAGTMRFESPDDHWSFNTSIAGPIARLVADLDDDQLRAARATLDAALTDFTHDGAVELPWASICTRASAA